MPNTYQGTMSFKHKRLDNFFFDWVFNTTTRKLDTIDGPAMIAELCERRLSVWRTSMLWNMTMGPPYWSMLRGDNQPPDEELVKLTLAKVAMQDPRMSRLLRPLSIIEDRNNRIWEISIYAQLTDGRTLEDVFGIPYPQDSIDIGGY